MYDIIILSGGFDPVHKGHVRMIMSSSQVGKKVIVGVNSDIWLRRKKGKEFMHQDERLEIINAFKGVYEARLFNDDDNSASDLIKMIRQENPECSIAFANGGDRIYENIPEIQTCLDNKVEMIWNVGGEKIQSSSSLVTNAKSNIVSLDNKV